MNSICNGCARDQCRRKFTIDVCVWRVPRGAQTEQRLQGLAHEMDCRYQKHNNDMKEGGPRRWR